ncbi:hypothetical protein LINPERPRIM_LOCUS35769 [Linum perenne]
MLQIYQALLVHQGPIHRFELAIPGMDCYPQIDQLVPYLSTKSVKELTIYSPEGHFSKALPSSIFSILNLNSLKLQRYKFIVPPSVIVSLFAALPALKQLKLGLELLCQHDEHYEDHSEVIDSLQMLLEPKGDRHCGGVCCLQRLEEFSIDNSRCNQVVLDLVRFVLATAPLLKRVFIKPKKGLSSRNAKKFLVKVTRYNRISKEGEVRYMD